MTTPEASGRSVAPGANAAARSIHRKLMLLQAIMLAGLALSIYEQQWLNAAAVSGILLLTALPKLIVWRLEIFIPAELELLTIAFIFAALFLGETRGYYGRFWWWDIALHTTSGVLLGIFGFLLVYVLNGIPRLELRLRQGFVAFFAFCFALSAGVVWEIFEFAMDALLGMHMQKPFLGDPSGLTDTMWDLIVDAVGSVGDCAVRLSIHEARHGVAAGTLDWTVHRWQPTHVQARLSASGCARCGWLGAWAVEIFGMRKWLCEDRFSTIRRCTVVLWSA